MLARSDRFAGGTSHVASPPRSGRTSRRSSLTTSTPKALGRVIRFARVVESVRPALWDGGQGTVAAAPDNWARLASELGYADQSHLVRDIRAFAGAAPSELPHLLTPEFYPLGSGSNSSKPRAASEPMLEP
jgi:hypothetical protein